MAKAATAFQVPKHAKKVDNGIIGFWKPDTEGQGIQGIVGHVVDATNRDGQTNQFYTLRVTTEESGPIVSGTGRVLKTEVGRMVGVGGRTVLNFLSEHIGQEVILIYRGLGDAKKGRNAPKLYDTYELNEGGES
jgi:hypothetical protein